MSVIIPVEAKSPKGILFRTIVIIAVLIGSVTMVYPFLLMVSGSLRSEMDAAEMDLVPNYFVERPALVRKFLETKYSHDVSVMNRMRGYQDFGFVQATVPERVVPARVHDLRRFTEEVEMPEHWWILGGTELYKMIASRNLTRFVKRLRERYNNNLADLNEDLGAPLRKWRHVSFITPEWTTQRYDYRRTPFFEEYFALLRERPLAERALVSISGAFMQNVVAPTYGTSSAEAYNRAHSKKVDRLEDLCLPRTLPGQDEAVLRSEWLTFVFEILNLSFVRTTVPDEQYQKFLAEKYGKVDDLKKRWGKAKLTRFEEVRLPEDTAWVPAAQRQDYQTFLKSVPQETLYLVGPEYAWHDWVKAKYADRSALNAAHEANYANFGAVRVPLDQIECEYVLSNADSLKWEYATRNFVNVFDEVIVQGRPFMNTVVFVGLSLVLCLTLQPLAAYSLSRFSPPGTWRLILIFMATMAFPPMVGMIPQFLILRRLDLLNTFFALVLPIIVNGYLIFLLKGFFDSLPRHLYEAALIDGASELRMFWEITMALSKPILAIVALQTFRHAWIAFMYPLLVCPKEEMHVLAVWLHQFQKTAPTPAVFASILITSLPTLLIFIFTQRTIMRGIAVPSEK